jgi:acyl carrier protein
MNSPSEKLRALAADILQIDISPGQQIERASCGRWDSLNHLRLIMAVEEEFAVRLEPDEIANIASLTDLQSMLDCKSVAA